jgi:heat-inducible transcriptional repressor
MVIVLDGAKVKEKLVTFDETLSQVSLALISGKLNSAYSGLTAREIADKKLELSVEEKQATDFLVEIMNSEDTQEYEEPCLEGWHFILNQPEFAHSDQMSSLMELVERRGLLKVIVPTRLSPHGVQVIIGKENQDTAIQNCSVVICRYGIPSEASGTIAVVGPTRMPYSRTIPTVYYLSSVLGQLVSGLYGREISAEQD